VTPIAVHVASIALPVSGGDLPNVAILNFVLVAEIQHRLPVAAGQRLFLHRARFHLGPAKDLPRRLHVCFVGRVKQLDTDDRHNPARSFLRFEGVGDA